MKISGFDYDVRTMITFTREEAELLLAMSQRHGDGHCRAVAHPGRDSFLWAMTAFLREEREKNTQVQDYLLSTRDLDTLCKICEVAQTDAEKGLWWCVKSALRTAIAEYPRIKQYAPVL